MWEILHVENLWSHYGSLFVPSPSIKSSRRNLLQEKNLLFIFLLIKCPVISQSCCLLYNKISATSKFKPAGAVKTSSHFKWFLYLSQFHELKYRVSPSFWRPHCASSGRHEGLLTPCIPEIRGQQQCAPLVKSCWPLEGGLVWKQVLIFRMWLVLITTPSSHLHEPWNVFQSRGLDVICHHRPAAQADHSCISAFLSRPEKRIRTVMRSTFVRAFTFNDMVTTPRNYIDHLKNERQAQSSLLCSWELQSLCLGYTWMSLCSEKKNIFTSN